MSKDDNSVVLVSSMGPFNGETTVNETKKLRKEVTCDAIVILCARCTGLLDLGRVL